MAEQDLGGLKPCFPVIAGTALNFLREEESVLPEGEERFEKSLRSGSDVDYSLRAGGPDFPDRAIDVDITLPKRTGFIETATRQFHELRKLRVGSHFIPSGGIAAAGGSPAIALDAGQLPALLRAERPADVLGCTSALLGVDDAPACRLAGAGASAGSLFSAARNASRSAW